MAVGFTNISLVNAVCRLDILLFVLAKQLRSCVYSQGHLLTIGELVLLEMGYKRSTSVIIKMEKKQFLKNVG